MYLLFTIFTFFTQFNLNASHERRIPLYLEYAENKEDREWGLMGRGELLKNHGMLFIFPGEERATFWMFNCFIDLSVAFINKEGFIQEIKHLKSFPSMMDPARQVLTLSDMKKYPPEDKIVKFFHRRRVISKQKVPLSLEMAGNWFAENGVKIGDRLIFHKDSPNAEIILD